MDPRRVLTFRQVAHQRSFSRAARTLSLTQRSVSHQVALLERQIGGKLFDHRPGRLRLTPAGEGLLAHAHIITERLNLAERPLREILHQPGERLRIGAVASALAGLVTAALERLREQAPTALVTVAEGTSDALPACVRSGELHLAVGFQDAGRDREDHDGLERHDLIRERFLVALPPRHPLAARTSVRLADLADDDWTAASPVASWIRSVMAARLATDRGTGDAPCTRR